MTNEQLIQLYSTLVTQTDSKDPITTIQNILAYTEGAVNEL